MPRCPGVKTGVLFLSLALGSGLLPAYAGGRNKVVLRKAVGFRATAAGLRELAVRLVERQSKGGKGLLLPAVPPFREAVVLPLGKDNLDLEMASDPTTGEALLRVAFRMPGTVALPLRFGPVSATVEVGRLEAAVLLEVRAVLPCDEEGRPLSLTPRPALLVKRVEKARIGKLHLRGVNSLLERDPEGLGRFLGALLGLGFSRRTMIMVTSDMIARLCHRKSELARRAEKKVGELLGERVGQNLLQGLSLPAPSGKYRVSLEPCDIRLEQQALACYFDLQVVPSASGIPPWRSGTGEPAAGDALAGTPAPLALYLSSPFLDRWSEWFPGGETLPGWAVGQAEAGKLRQMLFGAFPEDPGRPDAWESEFGPEGLLLSWYPEGKR